MFKSTKRQLRLSHPLPEAGPLLSWYLSYTYQGVQDGRGRKDLNVGYTYRSSVKWNRGQTGKAVTCIC